MLGDLNVKHSDEQPVMCVISAFHRKVGENCAVLGVTQRVVVISYRRFGTTYRSHLQGSRKHLCVLALVVLHCTKFHVIHSQLPLVTGRRKLGYLFLIDWRSG